MSTSLTIRIPIRDQNGRVVDEKEVATFAGLLARAHEEGLRRIDTELIQAPDDLNGQMAIVRAVVETDKGTFSGIGDASPNNVNRRIAPHVLRMAETRAKARALRDAVNIGLVALEELGDPVADEEPRRSNVRDFRPRQSAQHRQTAASTSDRMSDAQRRLLFRLLSRAGFQGDAIAAELCAAAEVSDISEITKRQASSLIDQWKQEVSGA
jgi:hypothetical protein